MVGEQYQSVIKNNWYSGWHSKCWDTKLKLNSIRQGEKGEGWEKEILRGRETENGFARLPSA